jgi:hypothetical protein
VQPGLTRVLSCSRSKVSQQNGLFLDGDLEVESFSDEKNFSVRLSLFFLRNKITRRWSEF